MFVVIKTFIVFEMNILLINVPQWTAMKLGDQGGHKGLLSEFQTDLTSLGTSKRS